VATIEQLERGEVSGGCGYDITVVVGIVRWWIQDCSSEPGNAMVWGRYRLEERGWRKV
jgi:hypothetical protein